MIEAVADEQALGAVNLEQADQVGMETLRALNGMPYTTCVETVSKRACPPRRLVLVIGRTTKR